MMSGGFFYKNNYLLFTIIVLLAIFSFSFYFALRIGQHSEVENGKEFPVVISQPVSLYAIVTNGDYEKCSDFPDDKAEVLCKSLIFAKNSDESYCNSIERDYLNYELSYSGGSKLKMDARQLCWFKYSSVNGIAYCDRIEDGEVSGFCRSNR